MMPIEFENPILPGFYPDPSTCRVGDDFYLINSSFEFFPGVPLFHSRNLVQWAQIGNCLDRPSQLPLQNAGISDGIYAPTLRHHNGCFYMITSNRCAGIGNHFFVTAHAAEAPWSEPVWIKNPDGTIPGGVDPSLFFDEDGRVYFSCVAWDDKGQGIGQAEINLDTGRLHAPLKIIWHGTGATFPEGPHTYRIHNLYYLMIAEGGTEFGHKVTIARSCCIDGPYEAYPHNPILTQMHQQTQTLALQGLGHGDLLEDAHGAWWLIVHGFRTSIGKLHHLGRETVLAPVTWTADFWPIVNENGWLPQTLCITPPAPLVAPPPAEDVQLCGQQPPLHFCYLRNPDLRRYQQTATGLVLYGSSETLNGLGSPTWLGRRQQHFCCDAQVTLLFTPQENEEAGLTIYQTAEHHYEAVVCNKNNRRCVLLRKTVGDICVETKPFPVQDGPLLLTIRANAALYTFLCQDYAQQHEITLGTGRTQLLSTEAMQYQNFTGAFFAIYTISNRNAPSPAEFSSFGYFPLV
ncbi:MAG: glycoside hydrolase family 43 protein [Ruthenibacterium sp.]